MNYLLDTNTCICYLNGQSQSVFDTLNALSHDAVAVCAVVKAELFYGAMRSQHPAKTLADQQQFLSLFASLPFDDEAAMQYGNIRATLAAQGTPIGPNDLMIAAIALTHGLTLVTHNTREFARVPDLMIEDWEAKP